MRVLHIADLQDFGGIPNLVIKLSTYQADVQGMDVAVLTALNSAVEAGHVQIYQGRMKSGFDLNPKKLWKIYRVFKQYDILHFHGFAPQVALCSLLAGRRVIHTEHGTFKRANQRQSGSDYIKKRILGVPYLERFPEQVVFVSEWLRRDVGLETDRSVVIHNGTLVKAATVDHSANNRATFNVVFAGRLVPVKRADHLISAFASVEDKEGVLLQIVGDGPSRSALEAQAQGLLESNQYKFYGYREDVEFFYRSADLVVLPTRGESFGLVAIEAMQWGVPVVCLRDGGGVVEILEGIHDKLVVDDLAEAITYWRCHPEERARISDELRERAVSYYTVERMAEEYRQLYLDVLSGQDIKGASSALQKTALS